MTIKKTDCVIIGSGPAGLSAAVWLSKFRIQFAMIEKNDRIGGELHNITMPINDLLGQSSKNGTELLAKIEKRIALPADSLFLDTKVVRLKIQDNRRILIESDGQSFLAKTMILATGLNRRKLDSIGKESNILHGLSYSATRYLSSIVGKRVLIVGGGDGAFENALILENECPMVYLANRSEHVRARPEFVEKVRGSNRIELLLNTQLIDIVSQSGLITGAVLKRDDKISHLAIDWIVIKIGYEPQTDFIGDFIELDTSGYVTVDRFMRTNRKPVFAAGDIANPRSPSIATSIGDGALAASEVFHYLRNGDDEKSVE